MPVCRTPTSLKGVPNAVIALAAFIFLVANQVDAAMSNDAVTMIGDLKCSSTFLVCTGEAWLKDERSLLLALGCLGVSVLGS